nr:acylneuraminate cytidylyltransferase [uncultured Cohaesibacter sp.]
MTNIAVIPARGGSKGVPRKNKRLLGGIPLVARSIRAALGAKSVDAVFVSSDDDEILEIATEWGAIPIKRPDALANDSATSESALFHVLDEIKRRGEEVQTLVFLQCTSPFTTSEDIDAVVAAFEDKEADSAFSVSDNHGFLWSLDENGYGLGVNHDHSRQRLRRQDLKPQFLETGAIYVMNVDAFRKAGHRFCGSLVPVPIDTLVFEIDSLQDWDIAVSLCGSLDRQSSKAEALRNVKVIVTDFDGVHTDDLVTVNELGQESVVCSRRDGMGLELLREAGYRVIILSKEKNVVVQKRGEKLQVEVIHGVDQKEAVLTDWLRANGLDWSEIAYVGNDINDIACMKNAALGLCPSDAVSSVLQIADIILPEKGGKGALRGLSDLILSDGSGH